MRRLLTVLAVAVGLCLAVTPASAGDRQHRGRHEVSVFPQPKDPWRSWGVHRELPKHFDPPHVHRGAGRHVIVVTPAPVPVWVSGQWWWNGYGWQWAPGHWSY